MQPSTSSFKQQHLQHWVNKYCRVAQANKKCQSNNKLIQNSKINEELFEDCFQKQKQRIQQKQHIRCVVVVIGDNFHHKIIKSQPNKIGFQYICNSLLFGSYIFESQQTSAIDVSKNEEDSLSQSTIKKMNISVKSNEQALEKTFNSSKQKIQQLAWGSRIQQKQHNQDHTNTEMDVEKYEQQLDQQVIRENQIEQVDIEHQRAFQQQQQVGEQNQSCSPTRQIQINLSIDGGYADLQDNEEKKEENQNENQYESEHNQERQQCKQKNQSGIQNEQKNREEQKDVQKQEVEQTGNIEGYEENQKQQQRLNEDEKQKYCNEWQEQIQKKDDKQILQNGNWDQLEQKNEQQACNQQKYEEYSQSQERGKDSIQAKQEQSQGDDQENQQQKWEGLYNGKLKIAGPIQEPIYKGCEQGQKQQDQSKQQEQQEQEQRHKFEKQEQKQNQLQEQEQEEEKQGQEKQYEEQQQQEQGEGFEKQEKEGESQAASQNKMKQKQQSKCMEQADKQKQMLEHNQQQQTEIRQIELKNREQRKEYIGVSQNDERAQQIVKEQIEIEIEIETNCKYKQLKHVQIKSQAVQIEGNDPGQEQIGENKMIAINLKKKRSINQRDTKNRRYKQIFDKYRKMRQLSINSNSLINLTHINTAYALQNIHKWQPINVPLHFGNNSSQVNQFRQLVFVWIDKDQQSNSSIYDQLQKKYQSQVVYFMTPLECITKQLINRMLGDLDTQFIVVYSNSTARSVYDCILYPFFNCLQYFIYCLKLEIAHNNIRNQCKGLKVQATNSPRQFVIMVGDYIEKRLLEFRKNRRHRHALN